MTWGNFVNGDPWIVVPQGQSVNLIGIEPAPRFIPVDQIPVTVGGSPTTANTLVGITSGITANLFGITRNPLNQQYGLYINGSILNPLRYGDTMLKFAGATFVSAIDYPKTALNGASYQHGIDSRFTHTDTSSTTIPIQFGNIAGGRMRFSATEANRWLNLSSTPRQLVSGDMLVSFECPFYENSSNFNHAALPSNTTATTSNRSDMNKIRFMRQAILTAVPSVPDENEFRPPLYWSPTRVNETDSGSSAAQRPSLMGRFVFTPEAEQKLNDNAFIDLPTKDIFDRDITPTPTSIALYNESDMDTLISPNYSPAISWGFGPIDKSISSPLANMWNAPNIDSVISSNGIQNLFSRAFRQEALLGAKAIGAFCSYISPAVRKKCIIQAIQYGIDMYGATTTGARNISGAARPAIILAGWFLNDYPMMLIDRFDVPQLSNIFGTIAQKISSESSTITKNEFLCLQKFMNGSAERLNSTVRFVECGEFIRITGKITDPGTSSGLIWASDLAQKYTDPMRIDDRGYGAIFKNNGVAGDFGLRIAIAGTTNESIGVHSSPLMGSNRLHTSNHAFVGITAVANTNPLQLNFPKNSTRFSNVTPYSTNLGFSYNTINSGPNSSFNPINILWKNIKAKVISGPGASEEVYRVVNTNRVHFGIAAALWSGLTLSEFYFDKPWSNGTPNSTSRIIFYPFDDNDVGKVVMNTSNCGLLTPNSSTLSVPLYNIARGLGTEDEGMEGFEIPSAAPPSAFTTNGGLDMHTEMRFMNILKWYGLLYALGKRNPSSGLIQNETTQDICDGVIHNLFGNDPFNFHMVSSNSASSGSDVDITTSFTLHALPRIRDVGSGLPGFGGILRQIWGRTLPR